MNRVNSVRYLGLIIDDTLTWKSHIECIRDKLTKGLGMLKLCYSYMPKLCLINIYNSFILPYLQYGIEFWGSTFTTYLEALRILPKKMY